MVETFPPLGFGNFASSTQLMRDSALLRATTDLFVQEQTHSPDEVRRYEELTAHLLPKVSEEVRVLLSERLANRADAPPAVVRMLAKDKIEVARAVLGASPVLAPLDLLAIIAATGREHHRVIAGRRGLTPEVRQALRISADRALAATLDEIEAMMGAPMPAARRPPPSSTARQPIPLSAQRHRCHRRRPFRRPMRRRPTPPARPADMAGAAGADPGAGRALPRLPPSASAVSPAPTRQPSPQPVQTPAPRSHRRHGRRGESRLRRGTPAGSIRGPSSAANVRRA